MGNSKLYFYLIGEALKSILLANFSRHFHYVRIRSLLASLTFPIILIFCAIPFFHSFPQVQWQWTSNTHSSFQITLQNPYLSMSVFDFRMRISASWLCVSHEDLSSRLPWRSTCSRKEINLQIDLSIPVRAFTVEGHHLEQDYPAVCGMGRWGRMWTR